MLGAIPFFNPFFFFSWDTLVLGCPISSLRALGEMHMNSECSLTSRFSSGIIRCLSAPESRQSSPGFPELKAIASRIGAACWLHASETVSVRLSVLQPWHLWYSDSSKQHKSSAPRQDRGSASPKPRWKCAAQHWQRREDLLLANQKDYFIMPYMNRNEAAPSLPPSISPPGPISYIFRGVQHSPLFCQCRTPIISHCWVKILHTHTHTHRKIFTLHGCWNMAFVRLQVANFIIFFKKRNTKKGDILNYVVDLIHIPQVYVTSPLLLHTWNNSFSARSPLWLGACNIHLPTA